MAQKVLPPRTLLILTLDAMVANLLSPWSVDSFHIEALASDALEQIAQQFRQSSSLPA